ncbi:MAG: cytochrome c biogenesis CcdA family protein, partial [Nanoarchaeota archaeon]
MDRRFLLFFLIIISISIVSAQLELPDSIGKIKEYNQKYFSDFSIKITFFIAFLAGMLGILSPCILPLLPAYFSYTFKEKKNITLMTFVFFLGFSLMFVILGMAAGFLGLQSLNMIQSKSLIRIAAVFIFALGIMSFFGKSLTFIKTNFKTKNDIFGVFLFGILFAISWTGCLGPVLSGILGMGAILGNYVQSGMLLFFYSLGTFIPLFVLSVFYDKFNIQKFMKGKSVILFGKKLNTINILSGILLMGSAIFLLVYGDTKLFNSIDPLSTKMLF